MRLNNKGFGMKETLIYLSILLLVLLIASCSISSFYDDLENSRNHDTEESYLYDEDDDTNTTVGSDDVDLDKDDSNIDYKHYYNAEKRFEEAAEDYALKHGFGTSLTTVSLDEVVSDGLLENKIVDYVDGTACTGYANVTYVNGDYEANTYILCTNYKTEGYR